MIVHVIADQTNKDSSFSKVLIDFLNKQQGPVMYEKHFSDDPLEYFSVPKYDTEKRSSIITKSQVSVNPRSAIVMAKQFIEKNSLNHQDVIIVLTAADIPGKGWSGTLSDDASIYFININKWDSVFESYASQNQRKLNTDILDNTNIDHALSSSFLPVGFELLNFAFMQFIPSMYFTHELHPNYCLFHYATKKSDYIDRFRSADVCPYCTNELESHVNSLMLDQLHRRLDELRKIWKMMNNSYAKQNPFTLFMDNQSYQFFIPELNIELPFTPVEKTVYSFFFDHPNGIKFQDFPQYLEELTERYLKCTRRTDFSECTQRMKHLVLNTNDSLSQAVSKLNRKIRQTIGERHAQNFLISGQSGEIRKINYVYDITDRNSIDLIE